MIVNGIVKFFKVVFGAIVKVAAWLLFVLGLWLPCLYCLVFLLACAFSGTALSGVLRGFIIGLVLSAVAGAAISYYVDKLKKRKKQVLKRGKKEEAPDRVSAAKARIESERENAPLPEDKQDHAEHESGYSAQESGYEKGGTESGYYAPDSAPRYESAVVASAPTQREDNRPEANKPVYDFATEAELRRKLFEDERKSRIESVGEYDYESAAKRRLDAINSDDEEPMVFRTRSDRDVLIYEYSDRLQIYRRTPYGMKLLEVRPKDIKR